MEFCPSSGEIRPSTTEENPSVVKAFKVYNFIVGRGGEVNLSELIKPPSPLAKLSTSKICEWLKEFSELAPGDQKLEKPCFTLQSKETNTVKVCLRVKLCSIYEQKSSCKHGPNCLQWHICREFLSGNCKDKHCSRSHDFRDEQNIKKAQRFVLEKLDNSCIRRVFAKNLPFLCNKYGFSKNGCLNTRCEFIHLCPNHVKGTCEKNGNDCPLGLSHSADSDNNKTIFKQFGVPTKYVLAHVLFPTASEERETQLGNKASPCQMKGKVQNLNNLDTETQTHKMVHENMALNIHQNVRNTPESRAMEVGQKQVKPKGLKSVPQLMSQNVIPPGHLLHSVPFPSLPSGPSASVPVSESQKKQKETRKKKVKINMSEASQREPVFGSKENLARNNFGGAELHGKFEMMQAPGIHHDQKKRLMQRKGFEKPSNDDIRANKPQDEKEIIEEHCVKNIEPSEEDNQSKNPKNQRKRQRNRNKKKSSQQEGTSDPASKEEMKEEEDEKAADPDLIQFDDDDYSITEEKLIDLEVDVCDPGLSQMSETQSQAMWDLFSQDLLYSLDDNNLSQSSDLSQEHTNTTPEPDAIRNASDKAIFNCLVMKYGGAAKFSDISNDGDLWDPCFKEKEQWFRKRKSMFLLVEDSVGNINEVNAICYQARMCFKYEKGSCTKEGCPYFHICKEYITDGQCSNYKTSCKKSHTFREGHNKEVAAKLFPGNEFTNQHLRKLILFSTLQVCMDYNNHCCQLGRRCTKVHVCKNFGYKRCPKGQCRLLHQDAFNNHNNHTKTLLARFRVRLDPKVKLFLFAKTLLQVADETRTGSLHVDSGKMSGEPRVKKPSSRKESVEKVNPPSQTDSTQYNITANINNPICLAFLIGKCDQGNKCENHHCLLPYQWVYKSNNKWKMMEKGKNVEIEKFYCEDNISSPSDNVMLSMKLDMSSKPQYSHLHNVPYIYNVNVKAMHISSLDEAGLEISIKRLSTPSSVVIPDCCLATTWTWYWKNEHDLYEEYKTNNDSNRSMSKTIEGFYQEGMSRYDFSINNHQYRLYFNDMCQKNMDPKYLTKRDVMRRPQFISLDKFYLLKSNCKLPEDFTSSQMPTNWKRMTESQTLLMKRLNPSSKECKDIKSLFINSMGNRKVTINGIDRVQNPFMWEKYSRKKEQMLKRSECREVDERRLFHGTSHKNIRSICQNNFDWRLSGEVTGDIYGKGTYFARDASFSHCYCHDDEDGIRYVFIAKVLVGSYTEGKKEYLLPPPKNAADPHSDKYDSCVDNVDNPQVFVVSDNDQYYPEYVIEYKNEDVVDQESRSVKHRYSDPMVTAGTLSHSAYTDQGASLMTSSTPDPYSQYSYPAGQAASMATASSTPYYHDQYSGGSYPYGGAAAMATTHSSPQHNQYSYPIGQSAPVQTSPSSGYQPNLDPLIDGIIDVGASTAHYLAHSKSTSQAASRPRSEYYSRSTSMPSHSSSNPGLQYSSRSCMSSANQGQTSRSRDYPPDVRPGGEQVKKNDGCSVM